MWQSRSARASTLQRCRDSLSRARSLSVALSRVGRGRGGAGMLARQLSNLHWHFRILLSVRIYIYVCRTGDRWIDSSIDVCIYILFWHLCGWHQCLDAHIQLSIYLSTHLSIHPSTYLRLCLSLDVSISTYLSTHHVSTYLSAHRSVFYFGISAFA